MEFQFSHSLKHIIYIHATLSRSIIAVNYEARNLGVTRRMRGVDAKKHCPEIELVAVPDIRGKADLTK